MIDERPEGDRLRRRPEVLLSQWRDDEGAVWRISAELATIDGRPEAIALHITPTRPGQVVTQRVLRSIPLERALRERAARRPDAPESPHCEPFRVSRPTRTLSDDELRAVSAAYWAAFAARVPVQKAVADAVGVPISTAAKQIMAARKRGFLPPATSERKGSSAPQ